MANGSGDSGQYLGQMVMLFHHGLGWVGLGFGGSGGGWAIRRKMSICIGIFNGGGRCGWGEARRGCRQTSVVFGRSDRKRAAGGDGWRRREQWTPELLLTTAELEDRG